MKKAEMNELLDLRKRVYHLRWVIETILRWVSYPETHQLSAIKKLCEKTLRER